MNGYSFTQHVRIALALAREEAVRLHHEEVGTEHILLGVTLVQECCAVLALRNLSVDIGAVRTAVESAATAGHNRPVGPDLPYTSGAKKVLELAMSEARELHHRFVGTEHVLLGLVREEKGIAGQVLIDHGLTLEAARTEILRILGTDTARADVPPEQRIGETIRRQRPAPNGYNFTTHVRSVLQKSRAESAALHHEYVGTEHILLALLAETDSIAVAALQRLAVDSPAVRAKVLDVVKQGRAEIVDYQELPYTSRAKKVLELAMSEARDLGHDYVGTEHLLLGLIREDKGIAAQVLAESGVALESARREVVRLTGGEREVEPIRGKADAATPLAESPGEFVVSHVTSETSGSPLLRMTLGGVSIVAGAITLVRLFTSDDVISGYAALLSAVELTGGALLLSHRTMRTGGWILLGVFAIAIVTRLAQLTFPGPVLVQAATTFFLLTRGRMSFRLHQNPGT